MNLRNVFQDFAACYVERFIEAVAEGASGGLYGDVIMPKAGNVTAADIRSFVRFQHGDNDYHYEFSRPENDMLVQNPGELAKAFLHNMVGEAFRKNRYVKERPELITNIQRSLDLIANGFGG